MPVFGLYLLWHAEGVNKTLVERNVEGHGLRYVDGSTSKVWILLRSTISHILEQKLFLWQVDAAPNRRGGGGDVERGGRVQSPAGLLLLPGRTNDSPDLSG